jgi:energy-coupling factor transporter ATP-binding protein EcfA2
VLGLVGTNGIGKSTALKILAGKLKPNLGRYDVRLFNTTIPPGFHVSGVLGSARLARDPKILSWIRTAELFHEGPRGQSQSPDQTPICRPHPPRDQDSDDR